jgi:hypothetical protein
LLLHLNANCHFRNKHYSQDHSVLTFHKKAKTKAHFYASANMNLSVTGLYEGDRVADHYLVTAKLSHEETSCMMFSAQQKSGNTGNTAAAAAAAAAAVAAAAAAQTTVPPPRQLQYAMSPLNSANIAVADADNQDHKELVLKPNTVRRDVVRNGAAVSELVNGCVLLCEAMLPSRTIASDSTTANDPFRPASRPVAAAANDATPEYNLFFEVDLNYRDAHKYVLQQPIPFEVVSTGTFPTTSSTAMYSLDDYAICVEKCALYV